MVLLFLISEANGTPDKNENGVPFVERAARWRKRVRKRNYIIFRANRARETLLRWELLSESRHTLNTETQTLRYFCSFSMECCSLLAWFTLLKCDLQLYVTIEHRFLAKLQGYFVSYWVFLITGLVSIFLTFVFLMEILFSSSVRRNNTFRAAFVFFSFLIFLLI